MAHPSYQFPSKCILVEGAVAISDVEVFAIQVIALEDSGDSIKVQGSGISEKLAADASDGATHLKADGSGDKLGSTHVAGVYERLSTVETNLPASEGVTLYGNFNKVEGVADQKLICYIK